MLKEKIKKIIEKQKESGDKKKIENMIIFIINDYIYHYLNNNYNCDKCNME